MRDYQDTIKANEHILEANRNRLKESEKKLEQARTVYVTLSMALHEYEREIITAPTDDKYKLSLMYKHLLAIQNDCSAQSEELGHYAADVLRTTIRMLELEHENEKIKEMLHLN